MSNPATQRQVDFIRTLIRDRDWPIAGRTSDEAFIIARVEDCMETPMTRFLAKGEASDVITWLKQWPFKPRDNGENGNGGEPQAAEVGVYLVPASADDPMAIDLGDDLVGVIVKVNESKRNPGRFYGLRWVDSGERVVDETGDHARGDWEFEKGLIYKAKPEHRMNLDQAKRFILRYGQCARCGRRLKAAKSVEQGIGPVCIKYFSFTG